MGLKHEFVHLNIECVMRHESEMSFLYVINLRKKEEPPLYFLVHLQCRVAVAPKPEHFKKEK